MRLAVLSTISSGLVFAAAPAWAQSQSRADTEACLEAHIAGQRLLKEGKLKDAAAELERCANDSCPKVVRRDCRAMVEDAKAKIPSVELDVSDHTGVPVTDATIVIDGKATELESGQTVELNPGKHWARVIGKDGRSVEVTFDLEEGQKRVRVKATLPAPPRKETAKAKDDEASVPVATWIGGGVAVVGLIGFSVFALSGSSKESDLDACKPRCDDRSVYEDMKRDYLIADVSLVVSVVAAGVGAYFYFTKDDTKQEQAPVSWGRVRALAAGAGLDFGVDF
jgi:hypothetical protein